MAKQTLPEGWSTAYQRSLTEPPPPPPALPRCGVDAPPGIPGVVRPRGGAVGARRAPAAAGAGGEGKPPVGVVVWGLVKDYLNGWVTVHRWVGLVWMGIGILVGWII